MIDLDELEALCNAATPGPWWNDSGNGQIESRNEVYYRAVVCDRAESFRFNPVNNTSADPRYEMCHDAPRIDPESDMEFIAAARTAVPELISRLRKFETIVENAKVVLQPKKDKIFGDLSIIKFSTPLEGQLISIVAQLEALANE